MNGQETEFKIDKIIEAMPDPKDPKTSDKDHFSICSYLQDTHRDDEEELARKRRLKLLNQQRKDGTYFL